MWMLVLHAYIILAMMAVLTTTAGWGFVIEKYTDGL
jgi:hypothetical protein